MRKTTLFYLIAISVLVLTFFFSSSAYHELVRYSELTNTSNTIYGSYQALAKKIIVAAVINPQFGEKSKYSNVSNFFYTDRQSVIEELELLSTTVKDSINIEITQQLDTSIRTELTWLLGSNVPDSIINRSSLQHIASLHAIDSLITEGMTRTLFLLDYRKNMLSQSISNLLRWMVIFILLSGFVLTYTIIIAQKRVASKIVKNEHRFRALIENYDAVITVVNEKLYPIYRTPAAERLTGYSNDDKRNGTVLDEVHPADAEILNQSFAAVKANPEKSITVDLRLKHKHGHYLWVEVTFTNLLHDPAVGGIVINKRDISERKTAEEKIRESEISYRSLIEQASDAIFVSDSLGNYIDVSRSACKLLGYSRDELLTMSAKDIIYQKDKIEFIAERLNLLKEGDTPISENQLKRKDGTPVEVEVNSRMLPDGRIVGFVRDITERKKAAEQLNKSERRFRALIENSEDIFALVDENMMQVYRSPSAERLTGYTDEDAKTRATPGQIHPDDLQHLESCLASVRAMPGQPVHVTHRLKHKLGHFIWLEGTFTNLYLDPDIGAMVVNMRDVTNRKNNEIRLNQTLREVSDYKFALDQACIVAITDQKGIIKYVNDNFCAISKYSREELVGKDHRIINSGYHTKEFIKNIWTTISNGKVWRNEIKNKAKDGTYYWVDTTIIPFLNENNKPYQYMAIRADITERKNAELKLSQTLKEVTDYKFALDESSIVAITDQKGIIKFANDNFCAISKYSREELIGQDHRIINSGYHPKEFIKNIWTTIANGKVWRNEIKNKAKDGSYYWVDTTIIPFLNEEKKPYQYMAIRADITERKKAEEGIIAGEEKLRFILDNMIEGVQIIGFDWKYIYLNNTAVGQSYYPAGELIGQVVMEKYPGVEKTDLFKILQRCMDERIAQQMESTFEFPNGSVAWFQLSIQPVPEGVFILSVDITERKIAEEKAIASEERFRALIENMSDAIVLNDADSNLIYQSPSVARILGYTLEERKGKPVSNYVHPNDRKNFGTLYKKLNENPGHPFPFQYRFRHKEGHYVWLEGVVTNLLSQPNVKAIIANYRDVTERKEADEKLRSERTLLRALIDNLPDYIYVKDTQSRHILNNQANVELIGKSTEAETLGKSAADILGPELARPYHEDDQRVFKSGKPIIDREETTVSSTGEIKYLLTTKVPLKDSHDNITGLVGISRDITKQKQVEMDLRNTNYFLESAQRVGKIGHWVSDIEKSGNLTWSAETYRIFGLTPEIFDGKLDTFFSFVHPDDLSDLNLAVESAVTNHHTYSIDHRIILRDGTEKWIHEQGEPTYDKNGNATRVVGIVQDITERKKAENEILDLNTELEGRVKIRTEQLQAANKEMEAFTYSVSHDLRSPLRIIDGYAQILIEDYITRLDEEGQNTLGIIMANAKKMGQLIDDLLNFSKIGRAEIRKVEVDMNRLVKEVIHELDLSGIVIPEQLKIDHLPSAQCDPNLMKNVWINLLSNAIKYSSGKSKPEIEVSIKQEAGKTIYYVRDNGAGFDMQYYHKLFGVFQRLHGHHEFSGTGVGLAIVQRIVSRHGGSVWAESKLNEGATFFFSL